MKISSESIEAIKKAADIVKVVGAYVNLVKKGENYVGLCPFTHSVLIRSFILLPKHQIYKCYCCGASGDSVKFVMDIEGLGYAGALHKLADKFEVDITKEKINN